MKYASILALFGVSAGAASSDDNLNEEAGSAQHSSGHSWGYKENGRDWGELKDVSDNLCGTGTNQSPIDLKNSWSKKPASFDNWTKLYTDQQTDIKVHWNGHTSQIAVNKEGQDIQTFNSTHATETYGAGNSFTGVQFHFHAGSEHTVEGKQHDLEMHTVHLPTGGAAAQNGFIASAVGLFFSVNDYDKSVTAEQVELIDEFFDALQWTTTDTSPKVGLVPYGQLMMMADTDNRWTYVGSVTTPPCAQNVYWNVLRTVYPVKQRHLDQFKNQLKRSGLEKYGNFRDVVPQTKEHNPFIIEGGSAHQNSTYTEKALNYLNFAIAGRHSDRASCEATCGSISKYFCCADVEIEREATNDTTTFANTCINRAIGEPGSGELSIAGGIEAEIECYSGAYKLQMYLGMASLALLAYV